MSGTSFICDPDLKRIIERKKVKTGKSQTRIINDSLRKAFSKEDINKTIETSINLHQKSIFYIKKLLFKQGISDGAIEEIEAEFEKHYSKIKR